MNLVRYAVLGAPQRAPLPPSRIVGLRLAAGPAEFDATVAATITTTAELTAGVTMPDLAMAGTTATVRRAAQVYSPARLRVRSLAIAEVQIPGAELDAAVTVAITAAAELTTPGGVTVSLVMAGTTAEIRRAPRVHSVPRPLAHPQSLLERQAAGAAELTGAESLTITTAATLTTEITMGAAVTVAITVAAELTATITFDAAVDVVITAAAELTTPTLAIPDLMLAGTTATVRRAPRVHSPARLRAASLALGEVTTPAAEMSADVFVVITTTADLTAGITFEAAVAVAITTSATLTTEIVFAGAVALSITTAATLTTVIVFDGAVTVAITAAAELEVVPPAVVGRAPLEVEVTAGLNAVIGGGLDANVGGDLDVVL